MYVCGQINKSDFTTCLYVRLPAGTVMSFCISDIYIFANITAYDSTLLLESVVHGAVPDVKFRILQKAEPDLT